MSEKEWLKQAIWVIIKSNYQSEEKVAMVMEMVEAYEAMKEVMI